jgi:nucleoside triphosphatase
MNQHQLKEMRREKPTVVVSAVIRKNEKYLIVRDGGFNFWRTPGGRVNWGEPIEKALKREMKEELGVDISIIRRLGFGEDFALRQELDYKTHRNILYFLCETKSPIKKYQDGIRGKTQAKWVSSTQIAKIKDMEPAFKEMIKKFKPKL